MIAIVCVSLLLSVVVGAVLMGEVVGQSVDRASGRTCSARPGRVTKPVHIMPPPPPQHIGRSSCWRPSRRQVPPPPPPLVLAVVALLNYFFSLSLSLFLPSRLSPGQQLPAPNRPLLVTETSQTLNLWLARALANCTNWPGLAKGRAGGGATSERVHLASAARFL